MSYLLVFLHDREFKKSIFPISLALKVVPTPARQAGRGGKHVTNYRVDEASGLAEHSTAVEHIQ